MSRRARSGSCARASAKRSDGTTIPRRWNGMATETRSRPLEGRSAVVTGVGSGLGQANGREFPAGGWVGLGVVAGRGEAIAGEFAGEGALVLCCYVDDGAGPETMSGIGEYMHADV